MSRAYFQLKIKNTTTFDADQIYVVAKGQDQDKKPSGNYILEEYFFNFKSGKATFNYDTHVGMDTSKFAVKLSSFPTDTIDDVEVYEMSFPQATAGARIYFSLGQGVLLSCVVGHGSTGETLTLADPDPFKTSDPNYTTVYDKIEFSYTDKMYIDTTAVDFFCMPLSLTPNAVKTNTDTVGLTKKRTTINDTLTSDLQGTEWPKLKLMYPITETVLRVVAPNKAIGRINSQASENFDENYLNKYIQSIWEHYITGGDNKLTIDCSELSGEGNYVGQAQSETGVFRFYKEGNSAIYVDIPPLSSNDAFGCALSSGNPANGTVEAVLLKYLTAGINIGLLPAKDGAVVNTDYYESNKPYYPSGEGDNPNYNQYSNILHSFGEKVYAFAYDDVVGEDSTLRIPNGDGVYVMVELGDLSGTAIPDPDHDDPNKYTINIVTGANGSGTLIKQDGTKVPIPARNNTQVTDVKSPFHLEYAYPGSPSTTYKVVVAIRAAYAESGVALGVNWMGSSGTNIDMALPG